MSIYQTHRPAGGGDGLFLKLKDGDAVKMRICSEPAVYEQTFTDEDGKVNISTRYGWVVWNIAEDKAQVFSQGKSVFNQLADLVEEWGEPTDFTITVKRTGERLETRYSVTPAPKNVELTDEQVKTASEIDLLGAVKGMWLKDLENAPKKDTVIEDIPDGDINLNDIPF